MTAARTAAAPPRGAVQPDVSLWVRLLEAHNVMLGEIRKRLAESATMPRFDLLANLEREDGQTLASLSRRMLVTAGNLTGLVPKDRRLSRVFLTPKGRALITSLLPGHADHIGDLVSGLDAGERRELRRLLGKLRDSLVARTQEEDES
jgi:DNA-binding MarR family transcriptional regulator